MRIHFDKLKSIYPCLEAGGVEIIGANDRDESLSFYLDMETAIEFSKDLSKFVKTWGRKANPQSQEERKP